MLPKHVCPTNKKRQFSTNSNYFDLSISNDPNNSSAKWNRKPNTTYKHIGNQLIINEMLLKCSNNNKDKFCRTSGQYFSTLLAIDHCNVQGRERETIRQK
jgi:hypothetical protein